jgi:hypothetical protein
MYVIEETIQIQAPPGGVWAVLSDLGAWSEWQDFIMHSGGEARQGATLDVALAPPGGRRVQFKPEVITAEPGRELAWHNRMMGGLFDFRHHFVIGPAGEGASKFTQREEFRGGMVWLLRAMGELGKARPGFHRFNAGLKERVEKGRV